MISPLPKALSYSIPLSKHPAITVSDQSGCLMGVSWPGKKFCNPFSLSPAWQTESDEPVPDCYSYQIIRASKGLAPTVKCQEVCTTASDTISHNQDTDPI